jgi:hypothetical protein
MGTHLYYRVSLWGKRNVPEFGGHTSSIWRVFEARGMSPNFGGHTSTIGKVFGVRGMSPNLGDTPSVFIMMVTNGMLAFHLFCIMVLREEV